MTTFRSQFLDPELKIKIDSVTNLNFRQVKEDLAKHIQDNFKTAPRDLIRLSGKNTPKALQLFFYNYILVSSGHKVL